MEIKDFVQKRVEKYYWDEDINCAITSLRIISEWFDVELSKQVIDAGLGMHGAGKYGAQCGLVEGTLMFIGILGRTLHISDGNIVKSCNKFAGLFENRLSSLLCKNIRPEGFKPDNLPHLCEIRTCEAICFSIVFITKFSNKYKV